MSLFNTKRCRNCGKPIVLVALFGWMHVALADNLDCEAEE